MEGWIKLHRSIQDHWLRNEQRPLTKFEAWLDILMEVNHKEQKVLIKGTLFEVLPGESINSLNTWADRWKWNKSKVGRFLKLLQKDQMIELKNESKTIRLKVCNYKAYQQEAKHKRNDNETLTKRSRNDNETLAKPNKNVKNDKNVKNEKNNILICSISDESELSDYGKVAFAFWQLFKRNLIESGINKTNLDKVALDPWERETRLMIEKDGRTKEELTKIYNFLQSNDFWKKNILSIKKLRQQFEKLIISANNDKKQPNQYATKKQELAAKYGQI